MVVSAALQEWFGQNGIILAAALASFVDTHSAAISVASLVGSGKDDRGRCRAADSRGTFDQYDQQAGSCRHQRGRSFAIRVVPGLILVGLAAWMGALCALIGA
jgi:hypothetical protein